MNCLHKKKLAFMSIVNRVKGFIRTITGALPLTLESCVDEKSVTYYKLYGQSVQNGTPMPDTPIEVESVGEFDESTGKYKIPIKISSNDKSMITNIYLDEPLRKVGEYADYVDFENGKVVRNVYYERITSVIAKSSVVRQAAVYLSDIAEKPLQRPNPNSEGYDPMGYALSNKFIKTDSFYSKLSTEPYYIQTYITMGGVNRIAYSLPLEVSTVAQAQEVIGDGFDVFYVLEEAEEQPITLPTIPTFKGTSIISVDTTIQASNAEIEYYSNVKE